MKLRGGPWSKGDAFALLGALATCLAIPGMPKLLHFDIDPKPISAPIVGAATDKIASAKEPPSPSSPGPFTLNRLNRPPAPKVADKAVPAVKPNVERKIDPTSEGDKAPGAVTVTQQGQQNVFVGRDNLAPITLYTDHPTKPNRVFTNRGRNAFLARIGSAHSNSSVQLLVYAASAETMSFAKQLAELFHIAGWRVAFDAESQPSFSYVSANGATWTWNGVGFLSSRFQQNDVSASAANEALRQAGFPPVLKPDESGLTGNFTLVLLVGTKADYPTE